MPCCEVRVVGSPASSIPRLSMACGQGKGTLRCGSFTLRIGLLCAFLAFLPGDAYHPGHPSVHQTLKSDDCARIYRRVSFEGVGSTLASRQVRNAREFRPCGSLIRSLRGGGRNDTLDVPCGNKRHLDADSCEESRPPVKASRGTSGAERSNAGSVAECGCPALATSYSIFNPLQCNARK